MSNPTNIIRKLLNWLWSVFFNGLLTILPITLTIALFTFSFRLITKWLEPLHSFVEQTFLIDIPYAEVIFIILAIFIIGTIMKNIILQTLIKTFETLLFKIPLVWPVYSGIKQLVHAFSIQDKITFKKVVLVEFPRKGIYSLGFMTSELPPEIAPDKHEKYYNVFIPTTPNPTSGFFVVLSEQDIIAIDLTRQEAMAMIISGGIIQPERFKF